MRSQSLLNLLVINDDQLYAERLVQLLSPYYDSVNLGFLDDKEELLKLSAPTVGCTWYLARLMI